MHMLHRSAVLFEETPRSLSPTGSTQLSHVRQIDHLQIDNLDPILPLGDGVQDLLYRENLLQETRATVDHTHHTA